MVTEVLGQGRACQEHGIAKPKTFAYPGGHYSLNAVEVLTENGYQFARHGTVPEFSYNVAGGRGPVYNPKEYHPLLIPSTLVGGPDVTWNRTTLCAVHHLVGVHRAGTLRVRGRGGECTCR